MRKLNAPIEYEQTDNRWRNIPYTSVGNNADTIGNSGCGPTCAARVVATLRERNVQPPQAAKWSVQHGYLSVNDGTYWGFFVPYLATYGIKCQQTGNVNEAITALRKNYMVITSVGRGIWTSGGHFILAYGIQGDKVKVHDPNSEANYRELANLSNYKNEAVQFWIIPEVWKVNIVNLTIKDLDTDKDVNVAAVNIDGTNYVKLRDFEKLAAVTIGNIGAMPTIQGGGNVEMTGEEIYNALQNYLKDQPLPDWADKEMKEAMALGITDGTNPMIFIPRYQAAIMAKRAAKKK